MKFLGDMMYGIMASGTTVLSEIVRSFAPDGKQRSVENRLSFNLERKGLADETKCRNSFCTLSPPD